jgi:hypothetical protein
LTTAKRYLEIGEREIAVSRRHELLALDRRQQVQHVRIQHVPGTHLLLDHVEACALDVK